MLRKSREGKREVVFYCTSGSYNSCSKAQGEKEERWVISKSAGKSSGKKMRALSQCRPLYATEP